MLRILKKDSLLQIINKYLYDGILPININYFYNFGSLLGLFLVIQIISGILLAFYYISDINMAFNSIEHIMREVPYGYLIRYTHANGAAFFFITVYLHIARTLIYGSYVKSSGRNYAYNIGIIIFFLMILTAFIGYSLVYGQMSYWAIAVITNLLTVIPYFGQDIVQYIYGSFNISGPTLSRFFALHYLLPFIIAALAITHLITLHDVGGSNPLGISFKNIKFNISHIPFHPYYTFKDFFGFFFILFPFLFLVFFFPNLLAHSDNYIMANPLVTPSHITPEFYLLPFYAILRSIPNKTLGVLALIFAILSLLFLPYLHFSFLSPTILFRPIFKFFLFLFFINFLLLIFIGQAVVAQPFILLGQFFSFYYFFFLFFLFPFISFFESFLFSFLKSFNSLPSQYKNQP